MKFPLLALAIAASFCSFAQSQPVLRAQSRYDVVGPGATMLYDSLIHVHINGHSSTVTPSLLTSISQFSGTFADDTMYHYDAQICSCVSARTHRTFNTSGLLTEYVTIDIASANILGRMVYDYNSASQLEKETRWNGTDPAEQWVHSYDNGKLIALQHDLWSGSNWSKFIVDSFFASGPGSDSVHYRYGWDVSNYVQIGRHKYIRDANNYILSDSSTAYGQFQRVTYYLYDPQGRKTKDSVLTWNSQQAQTLFNYKYTYNYDAQSNLTRIKKSEWNNTLNSFWQFSLDSFTYNTHSQVTSVRKYDTSSSGWKPAFSSFRLFYYHDPVSIPEQAKDNTLQLYPIPATTYINLNMSFTKPQVFSVRIFDMQGRLVNQWQEPAQKDYNKQIPLTSMAPGQYTLHIWAGEESASRQFMVIR